MCRYILRFSSRVGELSCADAAQLLMNLTSADGCKSGIRFVRGSTLPVVCEVQMDKGMDTADDGLVQIERASSGPLASTGSAQVSLKLNCSLCRRRHSRAVPIGEFRRSKSLLMLLLLQPRFKALNQSEWFSPQLKALEKLLCLANGFRQQSMEFNCSSY